MEIKRIKIHSRTTGVYNIQQAIRKTQFDSQFCSTMSELYHKYEGIKLSYYGIRGRAQVCRLLCQYLHLPYIDIIFTPHTWEQFKNTQAKNWNYQELPFLNYKDKVVTETYPICLYLINLANRKDLLGMSVMDEVEVDMFVWDTEIMSQLLGVMTSVKDQSMQKKKEVFSKYWNEHLRERLLKLQQKSTQTFYLPYLSIVDFYIYDIIYALKKLAPSLIQQFQKLQQIFTRVSQIPEISTYENSPKAIKELCPTIFCEKWKQKCSIKKCIGIIMGCGKDNSNNGKGNGSFGL